jgi:recombination protein RecA
MAKQSKSNPANSGTNADLDLAVQGINKKFGEGALMRLGDATKMNVSVISTGSLAIDLALGAGGLPRGRIVEIYGPESSGKTVVMRFLWMLNTH